MMTVFSTIQEYGLPIPFQALILVLISMVTFSHQFSRRPFPRNAPKLVRGNYPIIGAISFFGKRWDFIKDSIQHSSTGNFSFNIGHNRVVGVSGEAGRHLFFENRSLGFAEGYHILFNEGELKDEMPAGYKGDAFSKSFKQNLARMLRKENFLKTLPFMIQDTKTMIADLASSPNGQRLTDPFESVYQLVFQLTMRSFGSNDIANDTAQCRLVCDLVETMQHSSHGHTIIFPKIPWPDFFRRYIAGARFFKIIKNNIDERKGSGKRGDDSLQLLLDQDYDVKTITKTIAASLFAGVLNSGINACYVLCYLSKDKYWLDKVRAEVATVAAKYSTSPSLSLIDQLSSVPLDAWEGELPTIEMCTRDSIRLQINGTTMRRNISAQDIPIGNEVVPKGAFITYAAADVHYDESIYPNPAEWDPSRYLPERAEDQKKPLSFVGWGAGLHPCLGMRFAKLEQNLIIAFFVAMFDFELVDATGKPTEVPRVDINQWAHKKPTSSIFFKYSPRQEMVAWRART